MGQNILKQLTDTYRKVRNTFRFLVANLDENGFTKEDLVPISELSPLNQYILALLEETVETVVKAYDEYRFSDAVSALTVLMTNELSSYYLDYTKDLLYCDAKDDPKRRQVQTVYYYAAEILTRLWAPVLAHTTEELNDLMHFETESIHLGKFEHIDLGFDPKPLLEDMKALMGVRKVVLKALEEAKTSGLLKKSLQADLTLHLNPADFERMNRIVDDPKSWLMTSKVTLVENPEADAAPEAEVKLAEGHVCPRCWNVTTDENEDELCDRCSHVLHDHA
jgi:isoleucyl-tRNA synthetase